MQFTVQWTVLILSKRAKPELKYLFAELRKLTASIFLTTRSSTRKEEKFWDGNGYSIIFQTHYFSGIIRSGLKSKTEWDRI